MKLLSHLTIALVALTLTGSQAFAAGFEKSLSWSAKAAGQAGAVIGDVSGADALYFNPAGLTTGTATGGNVSLNLSPTFSQFEGQHSGSDSAPYNKTDTGFSPVFGALASYQVNDKLALGLGYYVSGGTKSEYNDLDYSVVNANYATLKPDVKVDLAITELAVGAGYEVAPGLKFGAAWRAIFVNADFASVSIGGAPTFIMNNVNVENISKTRWNGFKLGLQYTNPEKTWGLGANYRSAVKFTAEGDGKGTAEVGANGADVDLGTGKVKISNQFPLQVALGGFVKVTDTWKTALEYSFTNYSENTVLDIQGSLVNGGTTTSLDAGDIAQNWKNQHVFRIGNEYTGMAWPIRFGYALTTKVTPENRARATFSSPGTGHAIAAGTGTKFMEDKMAFDVAGEYSFASGKATNPLDGITTEKEFKSNAYVFHAGVSYNF